MGAKLTAQAKIYKSRVYGELLKWGEFEGFSGFDRMLHARRPHPSRSFDRNLNSACKTRRHPSGGCGVRPREASTRDLEPFAETST